MNKKTRKPTITITTTPEIYALLMKLCMKFGPPGVPPANMAATAFCRGLNIINDEINPPRKAKPD